MLSSGWAKRKELTLRFEKTLIHVRNARKYTY
jgi:hypothetical protein